MDAVEIGEYAWDAGIRNPMKLSQAIAIALAESGGNPNAVGDSALQNGTWGPSLGLWQIRSLKAETGKGTTRDANRLKDPAFNAKAMVEISKGGENWNPWSVWPLRAAPHMIRSGPAADIVLVKKAGSAAKDKVLGPVEDAVDTAQDVATSARNAVEAIRATYEWVADRNNWMRIMKVVAGGALLVGGLYLVTRPIVGRQVEKIVGAAGKVASVAPQGKAAKVAAGATAAKTATASVPKGGQ